MTPETPDPQTPQADPWATVEAEIRRVVYIHGHQRSLADVIAAARATVERQHKNDMLGLIENSAALAATLDRERKEHIAALAEARTLWTLGCTERTTLWAEIASWRKVGALAEAAIAQHTEQLAAKDAQIARLIGLGFLDEWERRGTKFAEQLAEKEAALEQLRQSVLAGHTRELALRQDVAHLSARVTLREQERDALTVKWDTREAEWQEHAADLGTRAERAEAALLAGHTRELALRQDVAHLSARVTLREQERDALTVKWDTREAEWQEHAADLGTRAERAEAALTAVLAVPFNGVDVPPSGPYLLMVDVIAAALPAPPTGDVK